MRLVFSSIHGPLRALFGASAWLLGGTIVSGVLSYIAVTLSARLLGAADFGLLGTMLAISGLASVLLRPGGFATAQLAAAAGLERRAIRGLAALALAVSAALAVFLIVVVFAFAGPLGEALQIRGLWPLAMLSVLLASLAGLQLLTGVLSGRQAFPALAFSSIIQAVVRVVVMAPICIAFGVSGAVIAYVLGQVAAVVFAIERIGGIAWHPPPLPELRQSIQTGASAVSLLIGVALLQSGDLVILRSYGPPDAVGLYAVCASLGNLLVTLASPIYTPLFPRVVVAHREGRPTLPILVVTLGGVAAPGACAVLGAIWLGEPLTRVLFGPAFEGAGALMPAYILKIVALLLAGVVGQHALATGRRKVAHLTFPPALFGLAALSFLHPTPGETATIMAICASVLVIVLMFGIWISAQKSVPVHMGSEDPMGVPSARVHDR
jgi:O-antigen/teichoic acid export membrane protein